MDSANQEFRSDTNFLVVAFKLWRLWGAYRYSFLIYTSLVTSFKLTKVTVGKQVRIYNTMYEGNYFLKTESRWPSCASKEPLPGEARSLTGEGTHKASR